MDVITVKITHSEQKRVRTACGCTDYTVAQNLTEIKICQTKNCLLFLPHTTCFDFRCMIHMDITFETQILSHLSAWANFGENTNFKFSPIQLTFIEDLLCASYELILDLWLILETPSTTHPFLLGRLQSRQVMHYI